MFRPGREFTGEKVSPKSELDDQEREQYDHPPPNAFEIGQGFPRDKTKIPLDSRAHNCTGFPLVRSYVSTALWVICMQSRCSPAELHPHVWAT
jgi:hypothetical protein